MGGDILRLHFWAHAFEFLKQTGAVFLQTEGKLKGCWVMRIDETTGERPREAAATAEAEPRTRTSEEEQREKVIVRSDGTVTYVGKDMAYQFWKFGLLGKDFHYRVFDDRPAGRCGRRHRPRRRAGAPPFGARLVGLQRHRHAAVVPAEAAEAGAGRARLPEQARASIHTRTRWWRCRMRRPASSGTTPREDADRPFVEVSGRKGLGVKADDLLERLIDKAAAEVAQAQRRTAAADDRARSPRRSRSPRCATS